MVYDAIDVASATVLLRAVSNQARLCIVLHLLKGERSVAELEADLGLRQPNLSQQLAELRNVGLVATRREAKSVFYRLADESAHRLALGLIHGFGGVTKSTLRQASTPAYGRSHQAAVFAQVG
jgi:DNA-binding transcriptional ArsR family regulator